MTYEFQLSDWFATWLGSPPLHEGEGAAWVFRLAWPWAPWLMLLGCAAIVAWVLYMYARDGATLSRPSRMALVALRLGVFAVLLFMLGEGMIQGQRTGLPYVVVMLDNSASMDTLDRYDDAKLRKKLTDRLKAVGFADLTRINLAKSILLSSDAKVLHEIQDRYKLRVYQLAGAATAESGDLTELITAIRALPADGQTSRLGTGVRTVLADLRGTPPAAIVVLTDGITTEGESLGEAANYARTKGVPLFLVGLGTDQPLRDVKLTDLLVDDVVFVDDVVNFQATITATGYAGRTVEVVLKDKQSGTELAKTDLTLPADGEPAKLRLPYRPTEVGKFDYIIEIRPLENEADTANNIREKSVTVRKEQIRVLLVQSYPNYEFRYLKQMLQRDPTIELSTVLQESDLEYSTQDTTALRVFPVQKDELFKYDVIVFGDVNPALLSVSVMQNLQDFVEQKGGGIAFIAGPRYMPLAYRDTPLATLFPIDINSVRLPEEGVQLTNGFTPLPTDLGEASPHMQLGDSAEETARIWKKLAPSYWMLEAPHLKPAARVLATHPTLLGPDGRKLPLFIMQYVGAGKVLFQATDETWRWRFRIGDVLFARYWVQAIRFLARSKLLGEDRGAELTVDREEYLRGEPIHLRVRFLDERLAPAADDGVTVVVEAQGRQSRKLKLARSSTSRAVFEGTFTGAGQGKHHVWMAAPTVEGRSPAADFQVFPPLGERERTRLDSADLARAASTSHGKFYRGLEADRLLKDLPEGRQIPVETLPPLVIWNQWWVLSTFMALLIGEWILRKRKGLL